jgi:hypothetical protein
MLAFPVTAELGGKFSERRPNRSRAPTTPAGKQPELLLVFLAQNVI